MRGENVSSKALKQSRQMGHHAYFHSRCSFGEHVRARCKQECGWARHHHVRPATRLQHSGTAFELANKPSPPYHEKVTFTTQRL
jgi:hypothetical protein